jgi:phage/plasmid-associated DNA primase
METQKDKNRLENQVTDELIRNGDVIEQLQIAESRLAQRESEIEIKNQEIADIRQENHDVDEKKKLEEIALDELIVTIKVLRKGKVEHDKKVAELKEVIAANEETVRRLKESLSNAR